MINRFLVFTFAVLLLGCSSLNKGDSRKDIKLKALWSRSTVDEGYFQQRLVNRMQPVTYKNIVIQGNGIDGLNAYDSHNGQLIWRLAVAGGVEGGATVNNGHVYFGGNDGKFYSLKADTGQTNWTYPVPAQVFAPPLVYNNMVVFLGGNNVLYALNQQTGELKWSYARQNTSYFSVRASSTPVVVGKNMFFGTSDGYLVVLNANDGTLVWEKLLNNNKRFRDVDATPVVVDDKLLISSFDGTLYCLEVKSGQTIWKFDEGGYLAPTVAGNTVYYSTSTKKLVALELATGKVMWSKELENGIATQPLLFKEHLVIGLSDGPLQVLQKNGKIIHEFHSGRGLIANPLVESKTNRIFFISNEANLYAINIYE